MTLSFSLVAVTVLVSVAAFTSVKAEDTRCFEMRIYHAAEGKLDALNARFRDHTCKLFEKHGMTNIGYWMPLENPDRLLIYVLAYPNREARETSWKEFAADPDWVAAKNASEKDGKLVTKADQYFFHATDYSPAIAPSAGKEVRTYELRTYTCTPNNLKNINARFRDHTVKLFEKHGMTNFAYWNLDEKQPAAKAGETRHDPANTLIYILAHKSKEAGLASFDEFRKDPDWIAAKDASEKAAGGSLTEKDGGVVSVYMASTDYSPTK